jgi:hypothetical protein
LLSTNTLVQRVLCLHNRFLLLLTMVQFGHYMYQHRPGLTTWAVPNDPPPENTDPGPHPPESTITYDDASWEDVQLPHDGFVGRPPSLRLPPMSPCLLAQSTNPPHSLTPRSAHTSFPLSASSGSIFRRLPALMAVLAGRPSRGTYCGTASRSLSRLTGRGRNSGSISKVSDPSVVQPP